MHSKSDNIEIIVKADEVIKEVFKALFSRYQIGLATSIKGGKFVFDCVQLLYYKFHKINSNRVGLHIDSSDWLKNKKATINPINKKIINTLLFSK